MRSRLANIALNIQNIFCGCSKMEMRKKLRENDEHSLIKKKRSWLKYFVQFQLIKIS